MHAMDTLLAMDPLAFLGALIGPVLALVGLWAWITGREPQPMEA